MPPLMATRKSEVDRSEELAQEFGENAAYVAELLVRYRADPNSVGEEWRAYFRERLNEPAFTPSPQLPVPPSEPQKARAGEAAPAGGAAASVRVAGERATLRGAALRIAENMEASLSVPTATSQRQIPIKVLEENRRLANDWREAHGEPKISFTQWIGWAIVRTLKDFPRLNDSYDAGPGGPSRVARGEIRFGLAVDVAKADGSRSLVVPNVPASERKSFAAFLSASDDVIARARAGRLEVKDFEGTTVSLTNPGTLGTTASVPRLMPGQSLIVATGAIEYPAEFAAMSPETLSRLAVSKVVTFTSTYDHRVVQGAESGAFLGRVEELLRGEHGFYEAAFADLAIPVKPYHWAVDVNPALFSDSRDAEIAKQARVLELINAYRVRGHLIADTDPLRLRPMPHHPELDLETYGLTIWDLDRSFWTGGLAGGDHMPLREIVATMRRVYCGKIGAEYRHISSPSEKYWIRKKAAAAAAAGPLDPGLRRKVLEKLTAAESFERFVGTRFLGQRRYSIEGCETAIVFLDRLVEGAAARGVEEIVLGMAHRGRLNILANVVGNAAERIFAGFEGTVHPDFPADEGDVKYHQGARARRLTESGREIAITVPSNPSHLEAVDPVVEGMARAKQDRLAGPVEEARRRILPVLIHGDAAFAGQGPVVETLNLAMLAGYTTGGTVHLVINNQIGFTTDPRSGRSSVYPTDVAKINQAPIFHVNGDDPEAVLKVLEIALDYRQEHGKDIVVDLVGFRLHGHSEGDEPTYTQPLMYRRIQEHPGVRRMYADRLVREGVLSEAEANEIQTRQHALYEEALSSAQGAVKRAAAPTAAVEPASEGRVEEPRTGVSREILGRIGRAMAVVPSGFNLNPKMVQQLARRSRMAEGALPMDWGTAEGLAFGSLLLEGTPIRMSGEDSSRGTFAQRQDVLHDTLTGETWTPLASIEPGQAPFWIYDSPLSEFGVLGFEYGYSVEAATTFVLWEAQYGDFANGAQVILDQFVASAEDKWKQTTRMALLLPHGFEGQGPEHSSARMERYLQLCAEDNLRVCDVTTPAQYFHVLRRQMRAQRAKPLVLFTPKSLLRLPASFSKLEELSEGSFRPVIGDSGEDRGAVRRLLFCSGKVFYDLEAAISERPDRTIAVLRVEQLYPFPASALAAEIASYPSAAQAAWVQEEPENMGAWSFVEPRLKALLPPTVPLSFAGRAPSASPATGNAAVHKRELAALLAQALAS
jgi:2-oxoglutarate decarboxylase